jgi:coenzyme F420-reducing hydrogenase beta subunit
LFSPISCLFCYDAFAREADLAVGDPWHPKYINNSMYNKGFSFVVAHTIEGFSLINECDNLTKETINDSEVISSQSL